MEVDNEMFDKIVFEVTEKVLLRMPEVIGNLMKNHSEINKMTKGFNEKYPEFKTDPVSVQSVVGQLERENTGMLYEDILEKAVPLIKERMRTVGSLDISNIGERSKLALNIPIGGNGEL